MYAAGAQQAVRHQPALDRHQRDDADRGGLRLRLRPHILRSRDRHHQPAPARHHDHDRGQLKHGTLNIGSLLELETNLREVFKITEKAPTKSISLVSIDS